jgi:alanine dehydrogenase
MPGAVPVTSSQALNNATLPYGLRLAQGGFAAVVDDPGLRAGLNVHRGRITCKPVADSLGLAYSPIEVGMAA